MRYVSVACAILFSVGCTSAHENTFQFGEFYDPQQMAEPSELRIYRQQINPTDFQEAADRVSAMMAQQGYHWIGHSAFNGQLEGDAGLVAQAEAVGADRVYLFIAHTGTEKGDINITLPTSQSSTTSGQVNVTGTGGTASATYRSTTTTFGSTTQSIPYSFELFDQAAVFFGPARRPCFGFRGARLSSDEIREVGTNAAIRVDTVVDGSPFYNADILPGDIVLGVGSERWSNDLPNRLVSGEETTVTIIRNSETVVIPITLGNCFG